MNEEKQLQIRPLETIEAEINFYKQQTAIGIIEIGKRLIEAKEQVPHGEWGKWLKDKVEFSDRTARRFMQCAIEFENRSALTNLNQSKIFALLDVPAEEREVFISTPHEVNGQSKTVDEMTTRELQQAIKEKNDALKKSEEYINENEKLKAQLEAEKNKPKENIDNTDYELVDNLKLEKKSLQLKIIELQDKMSKQKVEYVDNPEIKSELEKTKKQLEDLKQQIEDYDKIKSELAEKNILVGKFTGENTNIHWISDTTENKIKMQDFLKEMAKYDYLSETFNEIPFATRKEWAKSVYSIFKWAKNILETIDIANEIPTINHNIINVDYEIN